MANTMGFASSVVVVMGLATTAWAQEAPPAAPAPLPPPAPLEPPPPLAPPAPLAPAAPLELNSSFFELLLGAEVAVKPIVRDGMSKDTVHAETVVSGIEWLGARSSHQGSRLLEWNATARLKAGSGLPADTFPGDKRTAALGIQLTGRAEYGLLPLSSQCGTLYVSAGVGAEGKATVMGSGSSRSSDTISASSPDAQIYAYARAGLGVACITGDRAFIVSPFVAQRFDSMADGSTGTELGGRAALWLAAKTSASLEVARMSASNAVTSSITSRAMLALRHRLGRRMVLGADASITRNHQDNNDEFFPYRERITPFTVTAFVAMKF